MRAPKRDPFDRDDDGKIIVAHLTDEDGRPYSLADALASAPPAEREAFIRRFIAPEWADNDDDDE